MRWGRCGRLGAGLAVVAVAAALGAGSAAAASLPTRLPGHGRRSAASPSRPTSVRRRRPGLRGREERPDQGLRQPRATPRPTSSRTCARRSTTTGTAGCSGLALDPSFPTDPYVYVAVHATTRRSAAPRPAGTTPAPTPPGADHGRLRRQRPACRASRPRATPSTGRRAGADRRLVPAVPQPLGRRPRTSARTARCTSAAATAPASTAPTTGSSAAQATRAATRPRARRHPDAAHRRGRRAALAGPAHRRPTRPASTARSCGSTRPPAPALPSNPLRPPPTPTPAGSSPTACATRSGSRFRPGHQRDLDRRRRLEHWEEIDRVADPDGGAGELRLALLRGRRRASPATTRQPQPLRGPVRRAGAVTAPYYTYNHTAKVVAGETCPDRQLVDQRAGLLPGQRRLSGGLPGALFFADYSRNCIWAMPPAPTGCPTPTHGARRSRPARPARSTSIGPDGDLFYADLDGGTIHRIQYFAANRPPVAVAKATPSSGAAPLTVAFDATGSSDPDPATRSPMPGTSNADGAYDDSTAAKPSFTYTTAGRRTRGPQGHRHAGATSTTTVTVTAGNAARPPSIDTPGDHAHLEGRRHDLLLRARDRPAATDRCRPRR